ncbi:MAG: tetratricopeptide repeat protein [Planctomycetota bacterium]|nr:tetratricopeptide repeat protein [Planctomycetota bacterium]
MYLLAILLAASPTPLPEGFVDDARCSRCHAEVAQAFAHHGMGQSFWIPGPENAIEDFSEEGGLYHHPASNLYYRMRLDEDGRMWMKQYELDAAGQPINEVEVEAHFAVGSGNHARTYLYRSPSGELWELPVSWYTGKGWRMSPGYDYANHRRLGRQVGRGCIFCHTALPGVPEGEDRLGRPITFPESLPLGIGCQRCHGPGEAHVELAYSADATDEEIAASILNPEDLPPNLADDMCLQCHMQPNSRLGSLLRPFDRGVFSYRPGEALETYLAHIDFPPDDPAEAKFEINHHGYQMERSLCVQEGGRIACLSCHDAHHKLSPIEILERTRTTCLSCHQPEACRVEEVMQVPIAEAQDCASCHMPHYTPDDVIHSAITDHRIQKPGPIPPAPTMDGPPPTEVTATLLHPNRFRDDPRAEAYPLLGDMLSNRIQRVDDLAVLLEDEQAVSPRLLLAQGLLAAGKNDATREVLEPLVLDAPWATTAHVNLAAVDMVDGNVEDARIRLESVVKDTPAAADAWATLATIHFKQGRLDEAIATAREVVALRPMDHAAHGRLGTYLARQGNFVEAATSFAKAEARSPGDPSVAYNLGLARWKAGDRIGADHAWRHALARSPGDPRLVRLNVMMRTLPWPGLEQDPTKALSIAVSFYKSNASSADATLMLALAMLADGRAAELGPVLQRAAELKADPAAIRLIQAMALANTGNESEGRAIFEQVQARATQVDMLREGLLLRARNTFGTTNPSR